MGRARDEADPGRGRLEKNSAQCLVDIRVCEATEWSTDSFPLLFGERDCAMAKGG